MSRDNVEFWVAMRQKSSQSETVSMDDNCDLNEALRCSLIRSKRYGSNLRPVAKGLELGKQRMTLANLSCSPRPGVSSALAQTQERGM
jgi:hypothetical protein